MREQRTIFGKAGEAVALVYYTHWLIQAVVSVSPIIISFAVKHRLTHSSVAWSALITAISAVFWYRHLRDLYRLRSRFANPDLEFTHYELSLLFDDLHYQVLASYCLSFRARRTGVTSFLEKFNWPHVTGIAARALEGISGIDTPVDEPSDKIWNFLRINFKRLNKNDLHTIKFTICAHDPNQKALPHLGYLIDDYISGHLVLRAISPHRAISNACGVILNSMRAEIPEKQVTLLVDAHTSSIKWDIKKPIAGKVYRIKWDFQQPG